MRHIRCDGGDTLPYIFQHRIPEDFKSWVLEMEDEELDWYSAFFSDQTMIDVETSPFAAQYFDELSGEDVRIL